jgi:hypothetical protein
LAARARSLPGTAETTAQIGSRTPVLSQNKDNFCKLPSSDDLCMLDESTGVANANKSVATVTLAKFLRKKSPTMCCSVSQ